MATADGQLFTDEFITEVIGIDLLRAFHIDLPGEPQKTHQHVVVTTTLGVADDVRVFHGEGRSIGFALADCREKIRQHYGR